MTVREGSSTQGLCRDGEGTVEGLGGSDWKGKGGTRSLPNE